MDETAPPPTTATSTSAAAMADSASTKISGAGPGAGVGGMAQPTQTTGKSTTSVKLVIKSSIQQYPDLMIESDLMWTVKELKTHISVVYPSQPAVVDQKLIYSGQLLSDSSRIKDVIRSYKDVYTQNHIIHLVCATKANPHRTPNTTQPTQMPATATGGDANSGAAGATSSSGGAATTSATATGTTPGSQEWIQRTLETVDPNNLYLTYQQWQQIAQPHPRFWQMRLLMHQQMMQEHINAGNNLNTAPLNTAQYYQWMHTLYNQYMQHYSQYGPMPLAVNMFPPAATANPVISAAMAPNSAPTAEVLRPRVEVAPPQPAPAVAPQQAGPAARRFPNVAAEEDDSRDWLELFFTMTRLGIFITILYFNSSPIRCLAVCTIALSIYVYHTRLFRNRHERNNNNINRNNNAAAAAAQIQQGVRQVQHAQAQAEQQQQQQQQPEAGEAVAQPAEPPVDGQDAAVGLHRRRNADPAAAGEPAGNSASASNVRLQTDTNNNNASVISVVRTFVVTFFTSLLPETPAL